MKVFNILFSIVILLTLVSYTKSFMVPRMTPVEQKEPLKWRLDLNVEPYHRWDHIIPTYKPVIQKFFHTLVDNLKVSDEDYEMMGDIAEDTPSFNTYLQEIKGIANVAEIQWQKLLAINLVYEWMTIRQCSGIICKTIDNKIIYARNWDLWPWGMFSKLSATVEVYRGDKKIAVYAQAIGSVFVQSGYKIDGYSITVNARHYNQGPGSDIIENTFIKKYIPTLFLVRDVLENEKMTYEEAVKTIQDTNTSCPAYIAVGGLVNNEGSIIEKQPVGYRETHQLDDDKWYLIVTNYDRGQDPGIDDRVTPAAKRLDKIGQKNINLNNLQTQVMEQYPSFNMATIYTVAMSSIQNDYHLSLWYGNIQEYDTNENFDLDPWVLEKIQEEYFVDEVELEQKLQVLRNYHKISMIE